MKVSIGITHFPRRIEVLPRSLATMPSGVFASIYTDGNYKYYSNLEVVSLGGHVGCFKHWYRVLFDLCKTDSDIIGIMSDDVQYHVNIWDVSIPKVLEVGTGYVATSLPIGMANRYSWSNKGWHECNGGWATSWGGGYLFPIEVARKLLKHPFITNHRDNYFKNQQIDHAIPEAIFQMGLKQWYHYPSLLNHIGMVSTIGHTHKHSDNAAGW